MYGTSTFASGNVPTYIYIYIYNIVTDTRTGCSFNPVGDLWWGGATVFLFFTFFTPSYYPIYRFAFSRNRFERTSSTPSATRPGLLQFHPGRYNIKRARIYMQMHTFYCNSPGIILIKNDGVS